jgi:hypothetical protein
MDDQKTNRASGRGITTHRMRFSLRWLFLITTYVAILTAGVVIGPPWLWLMFLVAILVSHIHRWRERRSKEAEAWYKAHPELEGGQENNFPTT